MWIKIHWAAILEIENQQCLLTDSTRLLVFTTCVLLDIMTFIWTNFPMCGLIVCILQTI